MKILGSIKQIIIYVKDMEKQVNFYNKTLGLSIVVPGEQESYHNEFWVSFNTGEASFCLHAGGKQDFGMDAPKFTFGVENIEDTKLFLEENNIKHGEIRSPIPNHYVIDCSDPEGNKFSVEQFDG